MERLRKRAIVMGVVLLSVGALIQLSPAANRIRRTEAFLEDKAPMQVGEYKFVPSPSSTKPKQSYVVHQSTYDILKPFGVVGRVYSNGSPQFDVLLVAGNNKESFHDQRVCFSAAGLTIGEEKRGELQTSRGTIPYTLVDMTNQLGGRQIAVYFYKGPQDEFFAAPHQLTGALLWEQLKWGSDVESVFYRFIPLDQDASQAELLAFVRSYIEEAKVYSGGYF